MEHFLRGGVFLAALTSIIDIARAQGVPIPSSAEAAAIETRTRLLPPIRVDTLLIQNEAGRDCIFGPNLDDVTVTLRSIALVGAEAFPDAALTSESAGLPIGQPIAVNDICTATRDLTSIIRNAGYVFSRAYLPEQDITEGDLIFEFQAVRVSDVQIEGSDSGGVLEEIAAAIIAPGPYNANETTVPAQLALGDRLPTVLDPNGRLLRQSPISTTALADADTLEDTTTFILSRNDIDTSPRFRFTLDNRGSEANGPWALDASGTWYETFAPYDILGVRALQALDTEELTYLSVAYDYLLRADGTALRFSLAGSTSEPGTDTLTAIDEENESLSASLSFYRPLIRTTEVSLAFTTRFDLRNSESSQLGVPATEDRLRVLRFGLEYGRRYETGSFLQAVGTLSQGIEGLGATETGNPLATRSDGETAFTALEVYLRYTHRFESAVALTAQGIGQLSSDPLLSAEECGLGGERFGRAYNSSEITGDHCMAASLEVARTFEDNLPTGMVALQPYGFLDAGRVFNFGTQADESLASAGFGLRAEFGSGISASLEIAKPIGRETETSGNRDPRLLIGISTSF
ncbi:MAG: ShlB/FhaC/HecB family hemolysin secretion/activation protein [Pseudomonadota bacterium]